tara:strand:+ start:1085 stop:1474 length:390 start_codon:yes stop_codon:yes gene_type:complete
MKEIVIRAKLILANQFDFNPIHFESHTSRDVKYIEGRRYLIYFLRKEMEITYQKILEYVPALTNHTSIIHHYKKMIDLMETEYSTYSKYENFKSEMLDAPNHHIENEIVKKIDARKQINNELYKLKKLL